MRHLILFIASIMISCSALADLRLEPRIQLSSANRLKHSLPSMDRSIYAGAYINWENDYFLLRFDGDYRFDAIYNSKYSKKAKDNYRSTVWINDFYIEKNFNFANVFIGYQKVVWGQADELRVVDVINPLDYRSFILMDLNEYMLSQPMLRVTSDVIDKWSIEGIWLFRSQPSKYPPEGSEFYLESIPDVSKNKTHKSEFGLSLGTNIYNSDINFYAFKGYVDDPVYKFTNGQLVAYYPEENMLGTSLSTAINNWVIRTEAAYFPNKSYNNKQFDREKLNTFEGLIGIDYLYRDWMLTAQVSDRYISSHNKTLFVPSSDTFYTLSLEGKVLSDKVSLRFSDTWSAANGGGNLFQAKIKYQYDDHLSFNTQLDILSGSSRNTLGAWSNSNRIYYSMTYKF